MSLRLALPLLLLTHCGGESREPIDGGSDSGTDASADSADDTSSDAGVDTMRADGAPDAEAGPCDDPAASGLAARPANATCVAFERPTADAELQLLDPWPSLVLANPLLMLQEPGTDRMFVIERAGRIVSFDQTDTAVTTPTVFGDIQDRVETSDAGNDERGLLGMALHPSWPIVPEVYVFYTGMHTGAVNVLSRFLLDTDGTLDEESEEILLAIDDFAPNHNGGMVGFGPCDGFLYVGTGDGGDAGDPNENGQDPNALLGKILRINVDARDEPLPYAIPTTNPFADGLAGRPEIFAMGFRNPWRWSFDRETCELWVGDVGQDSMEEIDRVELGGNYGWDTFEGTLCFEGDGGDCSREDTLDPVVEYSHSLGRVSIVGGYVYRGTNLPWLVGTYLFADSYTSEIFGLRFDPSGAPAPDVLHDASIFIASFAEDSDSELYIVDLGNDRIWSLAALAERPEVDFPSTLSATGCVDAVDPTQPATGLIPYDVRHPFWSDGATKTRWLALPEGTTATVGPDGDMDFPVGTVFVKNFEVAGALVETRLFMRHADGEWAGYSYEWREDLSDADLVSPAGKRKDLGDGRSWLYPARNECLSCHTAAAGRSLGLEIAQLNTLFAYDTGLCANQLDTLNAIGVFEPASLLDPSALPELPAVDEVAAPVGDRARAYLHVNCSGCHRPESAGIGDLRASTTIVDTEFCGVDASRGDFGVADAQRIDPGHPETSIALIRMSHEGAGKMPPLGTLLPDEAGIEVLTEWVTSLSGCE